MLTICMLLVKELAVIAMNKELKRETTFARHGAIEERFWFRIIPVDCTTD